MPDRKCANPDSVLHPLGLKRIAASISRSYHDKGAIVITSGDNGIRIGVHNLELREVQDALCTTIYHMVQKTMA